MAITPGKVTTTLAGDVRLGQNSRLFEPLNTLLILVACITKAFNLHLRPGVQYNIGDYTDFESALFPLEAQLPLVGPVELAAQNKKPRTIVIGFEPLTPRGAFQASMSHVFESALFGVFTAYYEKQAEWLGNNVNSDRQKWPMVWNFARVVRNAMSHGGTVNIDSPGAPTVTWKTLSYGPADNKRAIFHTDLAFSDILVLMIEMDAELDRLGCPAP